MALDPRMYRGLSYGAGSFGGFGFESSASSPSLRASEPLTMHPINTMTDNDSANVKVVVRVRQFIKRGEIFLNVCSVSSGPLSDVW
jgi:hypothetical protein